MMSCSLSLVPWAVALPPAGALPLLAGLLVGHAVLVISCHNQWYGTLLSRTGVHIAQALHALLLFGGPVALLLYLRGLDPWPLFAWPPAGPFAALVSLYAATCAATGLVAFPLATLARALRRRPAVLESNHTRTVDVAAELGFRPAGQGSRRRWALAALLPGNEIFQVDLAVRTLLLPRLPPAWDGLSILHLSDLHFCGTPDRPFFDHVMRECALWDPDVVAFTGDLIDDDYLLRWVVPVLGRLKAREGAFAILGNHDLYHDPPRIRRRLGKAGLDVLGNGWKEVRVRGERLVVIGHEGPWFPPGPDLAGCPEGVFRLCLSHTPDHMPWARRQGIDLMLAGHVHGGQIRLPGVGAVVLPSRHGRRYDCGVFHEPPTVLHVSRGLGSKQPLRYHCRPEVTKLVLRRADGP